MDLISVLWVAGMLIGLIAMIICNKKQKTNPAMQPIAFVMFVLVLVCAGGLLNTMGFFGGTQSSLVSNEMAFARSRGFKAGKFLAQVAPGKKVLYIAPPGFAENESEQNTIAGLKEGYGSENIVVDTIMPPDAPPVDAMMYEEYMSAKVMDEVINKYSDAGVIVTAIGLPMDAGKMEYFKSSSDRPALFLMNGGQVSGRAIAALIKKGDIAGMVATSPNAQYEVKAPGDPEEAFDIRYMLIDKNNVEKDGATVLGY